jgi:manganese-dependent inorganic pyrophosphatase
LEQKTQLLTAMAERKVNDGVDALFVHIVDILNETNTTLVLDKEEEDAIKAIYGAHTHDHLADLGNRISRKKQLVPACETYFAHLV